MDFAQYLSSKGFHGRQATGAEWTFPCFFTCNEPADSRKRKLYVNAETGYYSCKVCVSEGGSTLLLRHFGDEPEKDDMHSSASAHHDPMHSSALPTPGRRSDVLAAATDVGEKMLANSQVATEYLLGPDRWLDPESVVNRRIGWAPAQWPLTKQLGDFTEADLIAAGLLAKAKSGDVYEYYRDRILIPYIDGGKVVQIRGKDIEGRYYTPIGDPTYLYNTDSLIGATELVIVEGEFDCIMLADLLATSEDPRIRQMAVVGLAGAGNLPEDFAQRIAHVKRVFIATDPDEAGRKGAEKLKERLGNRGHIVEWPIELQQEWLSAGNPLKALDWTTWIGQLGVTVGEVADLLTVRGRLKTAMQALQLFRARPTKGMKLGFPGLDSAFLPGLLPGQVMVMLAKTGVGKTVLLCNLCYNLRNERVLIITLEMLAEEIWTRLARVYRFYHPWASDEAVATAFSNLRICDANRLSEEDFAALVEEYTESVGAKPNVVMVDYLGYYARGFRGGSQYEKTTDAVMQLKAEAKQHGLSVITPAQVNRMAQDGKPIDADDARDSGAIEETADLMVGVWRADDALDLNGGGVPNGKLHMNILKSRHGNRGKTFLLQMGLHSLVVLDDTDPLAIKAQRESHSTFRGETYDQWLQNIRNTEHPLEG